MARIAYRTCMNTSELERLKTTALLNALDELGGWPLLHPNRWNSTGFDITRLLAAVRRSYGNEIFFQIYVYADAKNTTRNMLYVS
jgi:hypothetical protein